MAFTLSLLRQVRGSGIGVQVKDGWRGMDSIKTLNSMFSILYALYSTVTGTVVFQVQQREKRSVMLKHIVMWRFKEEAMGKSKSENIDTFKTMLENLVGIIDEIVSLKVAKNIIPGDTGSDLVLNSEFHDIDSLNVYNQHPEHQKVLAFGKQVISERRAVDYEF